MKRKFMDSVSRRAIATAQIAASQQVGTKYIRERERVDHTDIQRHQKSKEARAVMAWGKGVVPR